MGYRYGAYEIDPKYLVFWICVKSGAQKIRLASDLKLMEKCNKVLVENDYPEQARNLVHIGFESQETVNRESNGNWFDHFNN